MARREPNAPAFTLDREDSPTPPGSRTSKFPGVRWIMDTNKWRAAPRINAEVRPEPRSQIPAPVVERCSAQFRSAMCVSTWQSSVHLLAKMPAHTLGGGWLCLSTKPGSGSCSQTFCTCSEWTITCPLVCVCVCFLNLLQTLDSIHLKHASAQTGIMGVQKLDLGDFATEAEAAGKIEEYLRGLNSQPTDPSSPGDASLLPPYLLQARPLTPNIWCYCLSSGSHRVVQHHRQGTRNRPVSVSGVSHLTEVVMLDEGMLDLPQGRLHPITVDSLKDLQEL